MRVPGVVVSPGQLERCAGLIPYSFYCHWVRLLQVLARYIARRGKALQGLNVLELGSGTGLVGLVAGFCGARVYITDQACARLFFLSNALRFITVYNP